MNCHKVQSLISAYVDSELSGLEMLAIRQHLSRCEDCREEFEALHSVKKALGRLAEKLPSRNLAGTICQRLDHTPEKQQNKTLVELRKHFAFPARTRLAAAGVGAFAALFMLRAGGVVVPNFTPLAPVVGMSAMDQQHSQYFTIPASVETSMGTPPVPDKSNGSWGFSDSHILNSSNGGGLVLASTRL